MTQEALVSLAKVYHLDMGKRSADLGLWASLIADEAECLGRPIYVVEVGCGDGRVPDGLMVRALNEHVVRWVGIDSDPEMVRAFRKRCGSWCHAIEGNATNRHAWLEMRKHIMGLADVVLIPYATLFLVPHVDQGRLLRMAALACRPGGLIAAEVFEPRWTETGIREAEAPCGPKHNGQTMVRHTVYRVDGDARTTRATRRYGIVRGECQYRVEEIIYWQQLADLRLMAMRVGLNAVRTICSEQNSLVPEGYDLLLGRA